MRDAIETTRAERVAAEGGTAPEGQQHLLLRSFRSLSRGKAVDHVGRMETWSCSQRSNRACRCIAFMPSQLEAAGGVSYRRGCRVALSSCSHLTARQVRRGSSEGTYR